VNYLRDEYRLMYFGLFRTLAGFGLIDNRGEWYNRFDKEMDNRGHSIFMKG